MKLDWLKEYNWQESLQGDYRIIADTCGIDTLIKLIEVFGKTNLYFSYEPLFRLREEYIRKNRYADPQELARVLGVSERTIYTIRREKKKTK